ncbi:thermonuclease [Anopheles sinensis]|uniref:Thermonuclease n=1 Tax=Anopheles sinensis TaxID=74873 RepID=A0A084VTH2_ANOSI|nr:thermonuclease [Anopheles sinensis]
MRAIFILLSVLAAVLFASAAKVVQTGNTVVVSEVRGRTGNARLLFKDAPSATRAAASLRSELLKRNL